MVNKIGKAPTPNEEIGTINALIDEINAHQADRDNPHHVTKSQVGLGNVNNTADLNKPISHAVQTALDLKQDTLTIGAGLSLDGVMLTNAAPHIQSDWNASTAATGEILNKPVFASVATSGDYTDLMNTPDLSSYATQNEVDAKLAQKVDKVSGKTLSTNDFTDAFKAKLEGIEAGAQVNTVSSVNAQVGQVVLSASDVGALPDSTVIPGKTSDLENDSGFITSESLPTNLLQNTATAQNALTILGTAATSASTASSINIGYGSAASRNTVSLGYNAKASNSYCTSIGYDSQATGYDATALGEGTRATGSAGIAIGRDATASATDAIQIGKGTNATAHSLSVGFKGSGVNYTLLNGDGTIPVGRLTKALPEQSGQSGKYLTTDGTNASWDDVPPSTTITYWETNGDHSSGGETV